MSQAERRGLEVLDALFDEDVPAHDRSQVVAWSQVQALREAAQEKIDAGWKEYRAGLRARLACGGGTVAVHDDVPRGVVVARIAALRAQFPDEVVAIGHRKLEAMTDGDLRSLLADIEELLASDA